MKRVITGLSLLLLLLCGAAAQSISQYEYWTDDDYANRKVSSATGSDISLTVSTETLDAGIHFLNFRACRDDGVWGNFYRYLYYIPMLKAAASGDVKVEYWLDDDLAGTKSETANGGNLSLTIDVSALKAGVHYFNCTPVATTGERGNSERYLFYVPQTFDIVSTSPIKGYEYWLDDNYASKKMEQSGSQNPVFTIGIGDLASGVHYFNCRAFNERGEYGNPVREMFYIPDTKTFSDAKLASYEYWIDDDYAHCVKGSSANADQAFTIDVSQLSSGVHYYNYWPIDDKGRKGNVIREMFYITRNVEQLATEQIEYEYWIDSDTGNKVTGNGTTGELVFSIDVSALADGSHTFNFRAKDVLEQWGDTFTESFEVKTPEVEIITITAQNVTMTYGDDVPELTYTVKGGTLDGEPVITTTATSTSPVGTYPITLTRGSVTNEHLNLVFGTLTIEKAPLTISVVDAEMTEGEKLPTFSFTYDGFKNDEDESVLKKLPVATTTATAVSSPGVYAIIVAGAAADNYDITYNNGTLTINKRPIVVGDIDCNDVIDIADVVLLINYIMGIEVEVDDMARLDMNEDGEINVADVVLLKKAVLGSSSNSRIVAKARANTVNVTDLSEFTALQMDVVLPDGITFDGMELIGDNRLSHQYDFLQTGNNSYRIIVYSMTNKRFAPVGVNIIFLKLSQTIVKCLDIADVVLVKPSGERVEANAFMPPVSTGITDKEIKQKSAYDVYDMSGKKVRLAGESLCGLRKGVYMVNGKKKVIR